jgi:tetratricopeptide (TPR) repeat protein
MRAWTRRLATAAFVGVLALAAAPAPTVHAGPPSAGDVAPTPAEEEVLQLYRDNRMLTARRKVEELLATQPDSVVGHYVLGRVLYEVEGAPARAMQHLGRARELYETSSAGSVRPSPLHREILDAVQRVAGELERHDYRLSILEYHDSLYDPNLVADRAWALLQLHRIDEARTLAEQAAALRDPAQKSLGLNALCGIAGHGSDRAAWDAACTAAYEFAKTQAKADSPFAKPDEVTSTAVHAYNAALAARGVLAWERVETLALAGTHRVELTAADPWRLVLDLRVAQGRLDDAVTAASEMQRWRRQQPPALRGQVRADSEAAFATLLLVAGRTGRALSILERVIAQPDRRGLTTATREQTLGGHALLRRAAARAHAEVLAERATWSDTGDGIAARIDRREALWAAWADGERVVGVLADDERVVSAFELFGQRSLPVPVWLLGDLVDVLGADIAAVALERARERASSPALAPYYDALWTEVHWRDGDDDEAVRSADAALAALPAGEVLLRARVAAIAADASGRARGLDAALPYFATALAADGGALRRLGLALPVEVRGPDDGPGGAAAELLRASPRLDAERGAFVVVVTGAAELQACLRTREDALAFCVSAAPDAETAADADLLAVRLVEAFHDRAFAMPMQLSNVDLGSLDGTSTVATEVARERSRELLDELAK